MKIINLLISLLILLSNNLLLCLDIEIWEYSKETIINSENKIFTGSIYLKDNTNFIISYKNKKSSYIQNLISKEEIIINDKLCPLSYTLNSGIHILFTEDNCIYTNVNSKFQKVENNIVNIQSLKAGIVNNNSELLVVFIGTNSIILFKNNDNKLQIKTSFTLEGMIIDYFAFNSNFLDYFYLLLKNNNKYTLNYYSIMNNQLNKISNYNLNIELYNITEIYIETNSFQVAKLILFSYNKNENNFIFYLFQFSNNNYILKKSGNKYNFLPFRNAKIIKAYFLPYSDYLLYLIEIEKEKYAGVLDISNNLIIYNFRTTTEFISFQQYYLIYGENNCLERLCPFNTKDVKNCNLFSGFTPSLIKITSKNINTLVNKCSNDAPYSLEGLYCYEKCPSGYNLSSKKCIKCSIYDLDSQKCVDSCKEDQIDDKLNGACFSCKPFNQYKNIEINKCVEDCSLYNLFPDENDFVCKSCQDLGKFFQDGKCVDNCGPAHIKDEEKKICVECKKETPYYQNGECVKECDKLYTLDIKSRKCILCNDKNPYLQEGKCVKECDSFHKVDSINKTCINCLNDTIGTPYLQDNECVEKCDKKYKTDETNYICTNCQKNNPKTPYLQDNQCVSECNDYYIKNNSEMRCYQCHKELGDNYYYFNQTCVEKCPNYYIKDEDNKRCYKCKDQKSNFIYYENGKCVQNCSQYYYKNETEKICIKCTELSNDLYFQDNQCVKKCNDNYLTNTELMLCLNCSIEYPQTPYYMENKCVKECNSNYIKDEINKVCFKCQDKYKEEKFNENGKCVRNCSEYFIIDNNNYLCINCSESNNNMLYQDGKCVEKCSPGYMAIDYPTKACINCYNTYRKYEENGECTSSCSGNKVNNPKFNQCQLCKDFNTINIFYDNNTRSCVNECPIMFEKSLDKYICQPCLKFYDKTTKICVDECPIGSEIKEKICEKCNYFDIIKNICLLKCSIGNYPFYFKEYNYSICYEGFCGYGHLLINDNLKVEPKTSSINKLYSCKCEDNNMTYGKFCQYKKIDSDKKFYNDITIIKPLQEVVYIHKKNIFTFEFINEQNIKSLRKLLIEHKQFIKRRYEYFIEWNLIQNNCPNIRKKNIKSNELYFIIEPGSFIDECENKIQLKITDEKNEIITINELLIKIKSLNKNNFNLNIATNTLFLNSLNNNFIKLEESNKIYFNYMYKYYYITEDGEKFSLTTYMKNNDLFNSYNFPYCNYIEARIKNDYGDTIEILATQVKYSSIKYKNISSILEDFKTNDNEKLDKEEIWKLLTELKSFLYISNNNIYNYNISDEKEDINKIIDILRQYLPSSIIDENNRIKNNLDLDEKEDKLECNVFISLINQLIIFLNKNNKENNYYQFYTNLKDLIVNPFNNNNLNIEYLSEETILSYLRTIDNFILTMNQKNNEDSNFYQIYNALYLLKNILMKNVISGTKLQINGNNFNFYLIKNGLYSEEFSISNTQIKEEERNQKNYKKFNEYKIEISKINNNQFECGSNYQFCISKYNYDYLYDEITYLKNEKMTDLIISITRFYNKYLFIHRWNKLINNSYLNNFYKSPRQISDYSFIIEILDPNNKKAIDNLKQLKFTLSFDLKKEYDKKKSDITCLALKSIIIKNNNIEISKEGNCITNIDSQNQKIVCNCNIDGEIVLLLDKKISSISKGYQYQTYENKLINSLSGSIILSSLALITFFSIFFIFYEFYEDKNNFYIKLMNITMRAQYEYENFQKLKDSSKCIFALYLLYYKYSFFNIFSTYKYNHPRYIRFFIEIIKILLNLLISLILFYYKPLKKYEAINELNYKNDNLFFSLNFAIRSFIYSLFASIILFFFAQFIYKIFEFKKIRRFIWKPKKDILKEFIFLYFKKDAIFNKKLKVVKKRMFAYANLCGKCILNNKKRDKFSSYLEYKFNQQNSNIPINDYNDDDLSISKNKTTKNINTYKDDFSFLEENLLKINNVNRESKTSLRKSFSLNDKPINKKSKNLIISKGVKPFTLSKKNKSNISMWYVYRMELIRNKYIFNNQNKQYYKENNSKTIKYIDLNIETQKNYSYILSNDLSFNQLSTSFNKSVISKIKVIIFSLFICLLIIDIALIIVLNKIFEENGNYIILNWLLPVSFQIIIANFLINYIFALFASFLLFSFYYSRKNNCFFKFIFYIFVEKYMRYLFKIRTLINKYHKEFENMK